MTDKTSTAPVMSELWAIHMKGPDDIVAMPSKAVADAVARNFNAIWDAYGQERGHDVRVVAEVVPWPFDKADHVTSLKASFWEYADLILPSARTPDVVGGDVVARVDEYVAEDGKTKYAVMFEVPVSDLVGSKLYAAQPKGETPHTDLIAFLQDLRERYAASEDECACDFVTRTIRALSAMPPQEAAHSAEQTRGDVVDLLKLIRDARHRICNDAPSGIGERPFDHPVYGPLLRRLDEADAYLSAPSAGRMGVGRG